MLKSHSREQLQDENLNTQSIYLSAYTLFKSCAIFPYSIIFLLTLLSKKMESLKIKERIGFSEI